MSDYYTAKLAVELFEKEYLGQDQNSLWEWAFKEATKAMAKSAQEQKEREGVQDE